LNKKKLKILHLAKFFDPQKGGIETITSLLVNNNKKFLNTVIYFGKKDNKITKLSNTYFSTKTIFKLLSQPFSFRYMLVGIREIKKADIVHIHSPNIIAYVIAIISNHKKIVIHWHSDVISKFKIFISFIEKSILNRCSYIICSSETYKNSSNSLINYKDKIHIIPYGIKKSYFKKVKIRNKIINIIKNNNEKKIIVSVGRLVPYKGYLDLIESSKYFDPEVITIIIGDGPDEKKLRERINIYKINHRVFLISKINNDELAYIYKHSQLYLCFSNSRKESFGISLIEAQSHGIPIIARLINGSGVNWININEETGYNISIENNKKAAVIVNKLLKNNTILKKFSNNSLIRFNTMFTFNKMKQRINDLYKSLNIR